MTKRCLCLTFASPASVLACLPVQGWLDCVSRFLATPLLRAAARRSTQSGSQQDLCRQNLFARFVQDIPKPCLPFPLPKLLVVVSLPLAGIKGRGLCNKRARDSQLQTRQGGWNDPEAPERCLSQPVTINPTVSSNSLALHALDVPPSITASGVRGAWVIVARCPC